MFGFLLTLYCKKINALMMRKIIYMKKYRYEKWHALELWTLKQTVIKLIPLVILMTVQQLPNLR
jgi:hypothetical protein